MNIHPDGRRQPLASDAVSVHLMQIPNDLSTAVRIDCTIERALVPSGAEHQAEESGGWRKRRPPITLWAPQAMLDAPQRSAAGFLPSCGRERLMSLDDEIIDTPDGPMTWAQWKKKNPVQIPSRRTKGKDLPVKVKRFTDK